MAFKKIPLTIDTMIRNPVPIEGINQEDNVELNIVVTENKTPKDLSSQTIKVYVRRIDGTLVEQTDQITPTNARKGEVTVKLKNSAFNKEGYALFQLDASDSSGRITSSYATFKIGKGLASGEAIANTNEIEALKKVEEYIKKANQELETFKQTVAEINENEATRQENEVVRVREEASRNKAEAIRVQQEATRKEKENERVQAEIQRIADEEVRRENEALRGSKELERKQAEELRKEKELLRIADENNRKVAESKRIEAESVRVEAEKLRVTAETGRVEAENLRATAEEERVAAETKREEAFNKFEGKISANTEELKNARTATTGEKFNTLDERIDCEVDRLNRKIEVSFLQQEDKENHVIENTVEGMTTDMIVKGRTLQNIINNKTFTENSGQYNNLTNEYTFSQDWARGGRTTISKNNTVYTVILKVKSTSNLVLRLDYDIEVDNSSVATLICEESSAITHYKLIKKTFNTGSGYNNLTLTARNVGNGIVNVKDFMILEGDYTNKPIPEYFEGIKSFGEQEDKISILSSNKNLFNLNEIGKNFNYKEIENGFEISNTEDVPSPYASIKKYMFLKKGTYTFSYSGEGTGFVNVAIRSKVNSDSYSGDIKPNIPKTFTMDSDKEVVVTFYLQGNITTGTYKNKYTNIQLVEGSKSLNYEPYKEDKKDILLSQYGFDEGLRGFDLTVYDELNSIRNVTIKRIEKLVINDINISVIQDRPNAQNTNWFQTDYISNTTIKTGGLNINNKLIGVTEGQAWADSNDFECLSITGTNSGALIKGRVNKGVTSEQLKERLKGLIVYCELAEPVETPLDESINLKVFNEKTYISFENAMSGTSSFKAPVDTTATITRLNRENRALEEENKTLRQDFESTTLSLTDSDLELVKQNVDIDFRLMEVEFALDIPQVTLSSNINFKKKGEVKSMARTPYAMMKIVILSGDYDREDYIHKVGKYYERGRMTKEEYDELMSLMTADEIIGG